MTSGADEITGSTLNTGRSLLVPQFDVGLTQKIGQAVLEGQAIGLDLLINLVGQVFAILIALG